MPTSKRSHSLMGSNSDGAASDCSGKAAQHAMTQHWNAQQLALPTSADDTLLTPKQQQQQQQHLQGRWLESWVVQQALCVTRMCRLPTLVQPPPSAPCCSCAGTGYPLPLLVRLLLRQVLHPPQGNTTCTKIVGASALEPQCSTHRGARTEAQRPWSDRQ
jgi:hypothetical protein